MFIPFASDVPFIVSGKRVGIIDPHIVFISNKEEGKTGMIKPLSQFNKFADQVAPFIGLFGFDCSTENYDGTLFHFPFRRSDPTFCSKIIDKCYTTEEAIADLYSSLMEEASRILLFLKCIESIELYTWDLSVNAQKLYLRIKIEPDCVPRVRELRRTCKEHCEEVESFTALGAFTVQVTDSNSQKQSFSWLTCNTVGSSDRHLLSLASKLQVLPWVGIAASLPSAAQCENCYFEDLVQPGMTAEDVAHDLLNQKKCFRPVVMNWKGANEQPDGFAFCFLPLKEPTGLPVSIHGYFRVARNRRSIEWPSSNNTSKSALWNKHLMKALVVPSYAILLASKQYLLSYSGTPALPPAEGIPDPYSWLPLPQEVKHSDIWRYLLEAEPSVQSLLTTLPVLWTAVDGGKWVAPSEACLVSDVVPVRVAKLLVDLHCPVVCLPQAVKDCFNYGTDKIRCVDQYYVRDQLRKNATVAARLFKGTALCLEVLDYIMSDLVPNHYSCLEGLPIVPLAQPGSEPVCLRRKQAVTSKELVYIVTDDLTRSILPGLDGKLLSHALPDHILDVFLSLADLNQFCVTKATPDIVCPSLIEESMRTWNAHLGNSALWDPRRKKKWEMELTSYSHSLPVMPEEKWLTNLWEWLRSNLGVSIEDVKHLPIVPMVAFSGCTGNQVQLCSLNALGMTLRQSATAVTQQIADMAEELGCALVPHSHIFVGHEDTLNVYLPMVSPLSLLRLLKDIRNASQLVVNLSTRSKDVLRRYLLESIAESDMESHDLTFFRSLRVFKSLTSEYISLQNLRSVIFPPYNLKLPEDLPFPTNTLQISDNDYEEYKILLGREPETLDTFIECYVVPFALTGNCTDTEKDKLFLWVLKQLRISQDDSLCEYLKKTAFLPSDNGDRCRRYCPHALYDPQDGFLQQMFLDSEAAFPSPDFDYYLAELKELGLQTKHELQRNATAFQSFIIDRAHAVIRFDSAKASQCSKHILKALCDADKSLSTLVCDQVRDIPFLFSQSTPPKDYPPELAWAGTAVEVPLPPSVLCASQDQKHLGHLVGSVSPVLAYQYKRLFNEHIFKGIFKNVSVKMVCRHLVNVVELDSQALSANAASVTEMMESVYLFLNQQAGHKVSELSPHCIWHESCKAFLPLENVAWTGISGSSLVPYRYTIQEIPGAYRYRQLWNVLGVQERLEPHAVQQVLIELQRHLKEHERTLSDAEVSMVIQILKFLESRTTMGQVLMPTVKGTLLLAEECTYDDRELSSERQKLLDSKGIVFTHSDVSKYLAKHFKVPPVTSKIARPTGLMIRCEKAGQSIELSRRIQNIIKDYKDSIDVFKELIQNADDAGATEVKFLIDWRQHDMELLFTKEMRHWQGPALYAYNNSVFSPKDFENIRQIGAGTKLTDPTKIGRFGLGFCSVYQLTDVPSFISANKLVVFDPHMHFLGASLAAGSPGISIDFVEQQSDIGSFYPDQMSPYQDVFGCNVLTEPVDGEMPKPLERGFQGTLFRLPFRGMSCPPSDICRKTFGREEIQQWKEDFNRFAQNLLVFLRHVKMVGLYELESGGNPTKDMKEVCVISCNYETDLFTPRDLVEEYHRDPDGVCGSCSLALKGISLDESSATKKGNLETVRHEQKWLVASAVGCEGSFRFAKSCDGIATGLIPLTEVAVKVCSDESGLTPVVCEGQLFYFLPLPIACDVKFLINGFFDVSTNRRSLKDLQDQSKKNVWNRLLIDDSLSSAVLQMFKGLQYCHRGDSTSPTFLESYYGLLPSHNATDDVSRVLKPALLKKMRKGNIPFFHVINKIEQCWKNRDEAHVLHQDFHTEDFAAVLPDMLQVMTEILGLSIATNVPEKVQDFLKDYLQIVSPRAYYQKFIPTLHLVERCSQERQIIFTLKNMALIDGKDRWLELLLKKSQCIPTAPNGTLVHPKQLIDPSGPLHVLFDECEEHFPVPQLRSDEIRSTLKILGMCHDILNVDDVVDRAQNVVSLSAMDVVKAQNRSQILLDYLAEHNRDVPSLSTIPFIPVMRRPEGVSVPWLSSNTSSQFSSASEMFNTGFNLVFSNGLILDSNLQHLRIPSSVLDFKAENSLEEVAQHLKNLSKWASGSKLSEKDWALLTDAASDVYSYLENQLIRADDLSVGKRILQCFGMDKNAIVWDENTGLFLKTGMIALQALESVSLAPYRLCADDVPALKRTPKLWKALGIRAMFSPEDCIAVLHEMPTPLTKKDASITVNVLQYLSRETEVRKHVLVPTTKQTLLPPSSCYYNDFPWKQQAQGKHLLDKYDFVDTGSVPPKVAQKFGVQPISVKIANPTRLKIMYEEKGQHIPLTHCINRFLEEYSDITDVFKELIQNADDAEAGVIKFLIDWRQHKTEYLLKPEMAPWQGPALYVYNDKTFSDQDFDNICELEGATKRRNPTKIGRFGVGFCAVYHLTDVPSFVSRSQLVILDPQTKFLTDATSASSPGICFDFVEEQEELASFYADQMNPYQGIFGCKVLGVQEGFDGTLFRFPFRSKPSDISERVFQRDQISELKKVLMSQADKLLVFLQHLRKVEMYELCEGQDHTNPSLLVSLERNSSRSVNLLEQFKSAVEHGSRMIHYNTTQQFTLTRREVVPGASPKSKKKKGRPVASLQSSSTRWLVASAMGEAGSSSWEHACSVEGRERGDVPLAEVAVPVVAEDGVIPPKLLQKGQVFCFLPLPITISDQKCLINGYFEISKNRCDLAKLQDEDMQDAWNRLLIRDVLVKAYIALLKHLTEVLPSDKNQRTQFLDWYYKLWPLATASHPLSKELQVAFRKALCESDIPLVWSLADGGKWLPVCKVTCLDNSFHMSLFDTVHKDILDILVQHGYNMAELPYTIRASLCSGPDSCLATVSFKHYCEEVLLKNLSHLPQDKRNSQLLFILKHLGALNDAEGENWLKKLLKKTACIPCEPNDTLLCPTKLVFPEGLLYEMYDVDEERFPSKVFSEVKHSLVELGMVVHKLEMEAVVDRAEMIDTLSVEKARQQCESFIQYLTTVHFVSEVKYSCWKWDEESKENPLIEALSDIAFLPVQQRPSGSTIPWHGDSALFASPREVYAQGESDLIFSCKLTADLPSGHDVEKLFSLNAPECDEVLSHLTQIVNWAEADETEMTSQDHILLDRCMPAVYEWLSNSLGCTKQIDVPRAGARSLGSSLQSTNVYATHGITKVATPSKELFWKEEVVQDLTDRPFIWQESNAHKKFHTPAQIVSDSRLERSYYPYLVKLNPENEHYQQFFKVFGVETTLTRQKIANVLKRISQYETKISSRSELMEFIVHIAQRQFHYQHDSNLVFYLPDVNGVMRDARTMAYHESIAQSGFSPEQLAHGWTHFVTDRISKADAKRLGVQDILANTMQRIENELFREEDFDQKEEICTRLNYILKQYPADVSIFKEFIQNAEDAMATEIAFVIDHRCSYGDKSLFAHQKSWKSLQTMPALLVFNNRKFQEADIQNIKRLGTGGKADASDKIGRFGIGFNVAYHVTDCPTLVSFGEGGLAENFCVFDPQFKYVPSRLDRKLPGARYRMKNMEGKNSSEHFPDQFAPFLRDVMPKMAESAPGSFADLEAKWPHGYSVFRLPLTRAAKHHMEVKSGFAKDAISQELLGYHMTLPYLTSLAKELTEQAPGMLLFLNHLKRISVFEVSGEGNVVSPWTVEVKHSSDNQTECSQFANEVNRVCASLQCNVGSQEPCPESFHTTYFIQLKSTGKTPERSVDSRDTHTGREADKKQDIGSFKTLPWSMRTAASMSESCTAVSTISRQKSRSALNQVGEHKKEQSDYSSKKKSVMQQSNSTSSWVISKRFGLSDIPKEILDFGAKERLFPLAGVAILLPDSSGTYDGSTFTGTLYSRLPLPLSTGIPAHINGHFWVDPSRKHLEGSSGAGGKGISQWNEAIMQEVATRAYVDAITHCKVLVKNSEGFSDWFNRLLLAQPTPSSLLDDLHFTKHVYQVMVEKECEILIADAPATEDTAEVEWLALTANTDNPRKGWFFAGDPEVRKVILSIGVKLVATPLILNKRVSSLLSKSAYYSGVFTVELARKYLKKIAPCLKDHKDVIVSALVPLLTYVLSGIESPEQCSAVNDLPLMLSADDQLRLIDTNAPLFSSEFIDLLPEHCMQRFVSRQLSESKLMGKLLKLKLVTPLSPQYLADNIDLPNQRLANLDECNMKLLHRLWHYIAISISFTPNILAYFDCVSIIPTSRSTVVSVSNCKTVLSKHGSVTLLRKLQLPVLDFSQVCDRANVTACVKERLAIESRVDEVLKVVEKHLAEEPTLATIDNVNQIEVDEFVRFLLKCQYLYQYVNTLKKLNIFNLLNERWESLEGHSTNAVYALPGKETPNEGLKTISSKSQLRIIKINHQHHQFYETLGVQVLDRPAFYATVIIPHFALLPVKAQIAHLQHMIQQNDLIALLEQQLCSVCFITDDRRVGPQLASEYFDPTVQLLKEFLTSEKFPPEVWCEEDNLKLLRQLGLRSSVSDDMWRQFAQSVKDCGKMAKEKAQLLLQSLHSRIQGAVPFAPLARTKQKQPQRVPQQLLQFLRSIADIEFIPYMIPSDMELLFCQLKLSMPLPAKRFICCKNSVFCETADEAKLLCLSKHPHVEQCALLGFMFRYNPSGRAITREVVSALGLQLPSVTLVCHNLKQLVVSSELCSVSSNSQSQNAIRRLQDFFTGHYVYLAKYHDEQSLGEITQLLKGEQCLFIPSDKSFTMEKGANLVLARSLRTRPYVRYLHCIPEYLASPQYSDFLRAVGVQQTLSAGHYVHTLERLATLNGNPNLLRAISALYFDLVALLEGAEGTDEAIEACAFIQRYGRPILLPTQNGELLPANQLVLNDAEWLKERLEQGSDYHFIMPPPHKSSGLVSLPPCLGVQPLSELIFEELDKDAVMDRDNCCEAELKAEAAPEGESVEGCPYSGEFVYLIQTEEFAHGLRRLISHQLGGKPLSMEHEQAIEAVQNLDVKCVYAIRTHLRHRNTGYVPGTDNDDVPCFLDDMKCLYVRFHPKDECISSRRLLNMVVKCINRILGGSVDAMHLCEVLESCNPAAVEPVLDQNEVRAYKIQKEADGQMTQYEEGQGTEIINDLELMLTCNFREGDLVKYCSEDSRMVIAMVLKVTEESSNNEDFPFPPTLHLKLSPGRHGESEHKAMSSLLICKFLSPEQIAHLESFSGALQLQHNRPGISQEKDVLLELPCSSQEDLQSYFSGISDALEHFESPQVFFAIERLLFQLHFYCVHGNRQPEAFSELVEVLKAVFFAHCTEAFSQSLERKISSLLQPPVQPTPNVQPNEVVYQRQESYRDLSSWSIPTVPPSLFSTGSYVAGSTYGGQYIPPTQSSAHYISSRQPRVRQNRAHYPILPAPGTFRGGGTYIWGGGTGRGAQQSIWPEVTEEVTPVLAPTVSLEDAFIWLKDACRTVQLVKEMEDVTEVIDMPSLEGAVQASVYKYPETLCFYAHEIVLKCLKAVFFAYCGLPNQLVECSNLVQLHQTLMGKLAGNHEVQSVLGETVRSYVHLVSGHGDCCRFPSYDPPALPCDTHSPAVAREVLRSAMCFVEEIQKLAQIRAFFPEGLESFTVVRPDSWTEQEGG